MEHTTTKKRILKNGEIRLYTYKTNKDYNTNYYINNKSSLLNKIKCDCGGTYNSLSRTNHLKTKKHNKFITL